MLTQTNIQTISQKTLRPSKLQDLLIFSKIIAVHNLKKWVITVPPLFMRSNNRKIHWHRYRAGNKESAMIQKANIRSSLPFFVRRGQACADPPPASTCLPRVAVILSIVGFLSGTFAKEPSRNTRRSRGIRLCSSIGTIEASQIAFAYDGIFQVQPRSWI